jgi:hypothetical protein
MEREQKDIVNDCEFKLRLIIESALLRKSVEVLPGQMDDADH